MSQWAGQNVKIELLRNMGGGSGWVAFDNVGANLVEENCDCYPSVHIGQPVDTSTGAETLAATDLSLPGRGAPVDLARSYNSMSTYTGTLGYRWIHGYEMKLSTEITPTAIVRYGSGGTARFVKSGGSFTSPPGNFDTLTENGDGSYTLATKGQIRYQFPTGGGALQSIGDRNNITTTLSYSSGLLNTVTDPGGRSITFTYNLDNRISQVTDPAGRTVQYGYGAAGDLIAVIDTVGYVTQYTYDNHRLLSGTDNAGQVLFANQYDTANRVVTQTVGGAYTTTFAYNSPSAGQTTVTDPRGNSTTYFYDTSFRTSDIQDAYGNYSSYHFDSNNKVLTATNQLDYSTLFTYDARGNTTRVTDALGKTSVYTYTALNDLSAKTHALGRTTSYSYDGLGNLVSLTNALNEVTNFGPNAYGELAVITNSLGYTTAFDYNSYGNLTGVTNGLGKRQAFAFDTVGRNTSTTDPRSQTTSFDYDAVGRMLTVTNPLNQVQSFRYDLGGHGVVTKTWDANNNLTEYGRNAEDWLTSVAQQIDGSTQATNYGYDANGNLTSQKFLSYDYDKLNRPITATDLLGKKWVSAYDAAGRQTSLTDPKGNTTSFGYDPIGRLLTITYPVSNVVYGYDDVGNRTSMVDSTGTTTYEYDAVSRPITITHPGNNVVAYHYDGAGNRDRLTINSSKVVTYTFDAANRLTGLTDWQGRATSYGYDDASRVITSTLPNNVQVSYGFDNANRLTNLSNTSAITTYSAYTYTLDSVGNRTKIEELAGTRIYIYNEAYWLKDETFADGSTVSYAFAGSSGNRATMVDGSGTTVYTYTNDTRLAQVNATTYTWDDNGNLTGRGSDTFSYDYADWLTQAMVGGITSTYTYNGDGLRVGKAVSGGATNSPMVWDVNLGLPLLISDSNYVYVYGLGPIGMVDAQGNAYYFLRDGLGSVTGVVDANGTLIATYSYDAYGNLRLSTGTVLNPFRYTEQWYDSYIKLYEMGARQYDQDLGRFLSPDSIVPDPRNPQSLNR
ncbi:MAG: RHS repeat protein, partial [Chloroflexi bacterium]|nr:RHS repeat protein [Chloroflexota bacterium]